MSKSNVYEHLYNRSRQSIKYGSLSHEKRALVIADLYKLLVEAPAHAGQFIFQGVRDPEQAEKATTKVLELYRFISINRIYLPESICRLLDKFESTLRKSVLYVDVYWTRIPHPTPQTMQDQSRVMLEACNALDTELPALRKELERELRPILGGS